MPVTRSTRSLDFTFAPEGMDEEALRVVRFRGREAMSRPFVFDVQLASKEPSLDPEDLIGKPATLRWTVGDGERLVRGIVARFERGGKGRGFHRYAARLVPRLWSLGLGRRCRIFQGATTLEIVKKVLSTAGHPSDLLKIAAKRSLKPRTFCVQYRESDLVYFSRLLEEDGIAFYFDHAAEKPLLVLADHCEAFPALPGESTIPFREAGTGLVGAEEVRSFRPASRLRPGKVELLDYDFKKPSTSLLVEKEAVGSKLVCYDWPGFFPNEGIGRELSVVRLEEERIDVETASGEGTARWFAPGFRFTLEGHDLDDANREYLLTEVCHWGNQADAALEDMVAPEAATCLYGNDFVCVPSDAHYRPPRVTPAPRIYGLQAAVVTGPPGEEIHTDAHGRVKVRLYWDREGANDDTSSCWIRVSQSWGGAGWGAMIIPRVGHEVLVEFLHGDPNRPIVVGRLYDGERPVPYALPTEKTKSTISSATTEGGPGVNELRFEDKAGKEEIFVNASRDLTVEIEANRTETIGSMETLSVDGNCRLTVGGNQTNTINGNLEERVKGNDSLTVSGNQLALAIGGTGVTIQGSKTETIGAMLLEMTGFAKALNVTGNLVRKIGAAGLWIARGSMSLTVGTSSTRTSAADLIVVKGNRQEDVKASSVVTATVVNAKTEGAFAIEGKGGVSIIAALAKIEASGKVALVCGDSSVIIDGGGVTLKSSEITLKASGPVKFTGSLAKEN